ncbi:flagellar hook-length control protein FliK [Parvibaculum sp.]|uniref:flagellar hook-length control protein FliK n=1 Tax=Parvibaculum sp. TaxID=2024848 RepID=UPI00391CDD04
MDLSSSATQRSSTSEALSIQPGSVRVTTAMAANEFARHLAENARSDAGRRRDDRSAERAERAPERPRETRDDKAESRKTSEPRETAKDEVSTAPAVETVAALSLLDETADAKQTEAPLLSGGDTDEPAPENVTPEPVAKAATETPDATPVATPEAIVAESMASKVPAGATPKAETSAAKDTGQIAGTDARAKPEAPNPDVTAAQTATPDASPKEARSTSETMPGKPDAQAMANRPSDTSIASPSPDAVVPDTKPAEEAKPAKGLGHEAAEQLAGKKADAKQSGDIPKATFQAVQQMAQQILRAAAPNGQGAPLMPASMEAGNSARALDMPTSGLPQSAQANGTAATVRIGTLPGQSQPTQVPAAAIALQMARNLQKGMSRFEIRLDPPEMGRIDVRMEIRKDGQVVAHMSVERPETLDLLQRDARALQQALTNAGLQADGDSLNFSLKDGRDDTSNPSFAGGGDAASGQDADDEVQTLPVYNVNLAVDGGVDIRV